MLYWVDVLHCSGPALISHDGVDDTVKVLIRQYSDWRHIWALWPSEREFH